EQLVDGVAHDLRADDVEDDAHDGQHDDAHDERPLWPERAEQAPQRATEVLGLGWRQAHAHHPGAPTLAPPRAQRSGRRWAAGPVLEHASTRSRSPGTAGPGGRRGHAATSASESCENTISRYVSLVSSSSRC